MSPTIPVEPFDLLLQLEARLRMVRAELSADQSEGWSGLAFRLRERWLVAPREDVREVIPLPPLTRIPGAKRWLLGVANVRGALLPVTDLGVLLDAAPAVTARSQRVLVFNSEQVPAGILVDEVVGHRAFAPADQCHELSRGSGAIEPYLLGAFQRDGRDWLALSLHKLTRAPAFADASI